MRYLLILSFFILIQPAYGQTNTKNDFSLKLVNKSGSTVFIEYLNNRDTAFAGQTVHISKSSDKAVVPFWLFLYIKDPLPGKALRSKNIRILFSKVKQRTVTINSENKVEFSSNRSENLYEYYEANRKKNTFVALADSIINANKNDIASAEIIRMVFCDPDFTVDTIKMYFNRLTQKVKKSSYGQSVSGYIAGRNMLKVGSDVKIFSLNDSSNKKVSLSDIKSDYILLDFWFSSCGPCIRSFPALIDLHKKTGRTKFEIIGISVDTEKELELWRSSIVKHQLPWINLIDPDFEIAYKMFSISLYPTKILLDKNRRIIKINPGNEEIEKILAGQE